MITRPNAAVRHVSLCELAQLIKCSEGFTYDVNTGNCSFEPTCNYDDAKSEDTYCKGQYYKVLGAIADCLRLCGTAIVYADDANGSHYFYIVDRLG